MGKDRSFASKMAKSAAANQCPTCGQVPVMVKVIDTEMKEQKGSWGFREKFVHVCKCNENEVYS